MKKKKHYYVYMLRMENSNIYTGYTSDLKRRFQEHCSGKGGKYTRSFSPIKIARSWKVKGVRGTAMQVESYIKRKPKKMKELFIAKPRELKKHISKELKYEFEVKVCKLK
ncbi:MAG: GIY-YIG nuclease family protein [Candidatus Margulisbacteria bacterium]|nr:GIY-YIG nuclease family protein [Candidatus Margulisiibacteriota bacterium]